MSILDELRELVIEQLGLDPDTKITLDLIVQVINNIRLGCKAGQAVLRAIKMGLPLPSARL